MENWLIACAASRSTLKPERSVRGCTLFVHRANGKSVSFPRVSPDGRFMLCTLSGYGTFPIWHKDADLYMIDLKSGVGSYPETLNSNDTESYHSWSSNGRWVVFSSRRLDGLYTRPFIAYVGKDGKTGKPFLLPQKEADYYAGLMKSYNIPEFVTGKVTNRSYQIRRLAEQGGIPFLCQLFDFFTISHSSCLQDIVMAWNRGIGKKSICF